MGGDALAWGVSFHEGISNKARQQIRRTISHRLIDIDLVRAESSRTRGDSKIADQRLGRGSRMMSNSRYFDISGHWVARF
jgi:hypothetical protein